jgi:hypothetical protein
MIHHFDITWRRLGDRPFALLFAKSLTIRRTSMKRITVVLVAVAVVVVLAVPAVYAASGCSVATLNGNYGFIQPGGFTTHNSATGSEVPWQYVGIEAFDGKGNTNVNYTAAVNGATSTGQSSVGIYNVNSDCTGSLSFITGDAAGLNFNIVIVSGGAEVFAISTNAGDTATTIEKKL